LAGNDTDEPWIGRGEPYIGRGEEPSTVNAAPARAPAKGDPLREGRLTHRLHRGIDDLAENFRRIVSVNRKLGFFTTCYNYLIPIIPILPVAPRFIRGTIGFGLIT
jgi:hypothetical protein